MKLGLPEIIFTIVVIIAIILIARVVGASRRTPGKDKESSATTSKRNVGGTVSIIKRTGIIAIIIGVILLIVSASMLRWALQGYLWAFIIILFGFILVFLTRRKR
jgi:hypothetical protein